jgi:hypothetical protein
LSFDLEENEPLDGEFHRRSEINNRQSSIVNESSRVNGLGVVSPLDVAA